MILKNQETARLFSRVSEKIRALQKKPEGVITQT